MSVRDTNVADREGVFMVALWNAPDDSRTRVQRFIDNPDNLHRRTMNGRITEMGTRHDLIVPNGRDASLVKRQMNGLIEKDTVQSKVLQRHLGAA